MSRRRDDQPTGPRTVPPISSEEEYIWAKDFLDEAEPLAEQTGHSAVARDLRRFLQSARRRVKEYEQQRQGPPG